MRALERVAPPGRLAVVAARANELAADPRATLQGVDACGDRVAAEVREAVAAHGGRLQRISVVGHSMGGLVARHAVGRLYDPATRTVAGLRPCHFITMATPHLGCAGESGEAQVPLVRWVRLPGRLAPVVDAVAAAALGRTGEQFFLKDGGGADGQLPLLVSEGVWVVCGERRGVRRGRAPLFGRPRMRGHGGVRPPPYEGSRRRLGLGHEA